MILVALLVRIRLQSPTQFTFKNVSLCFGNHRQIAFDDIVEIAVLAYFVSHLHARAVPRFLARIPPDLPGIPPGILAPAQGLGNPGQPHFAYVPRRFSGYLTGFPV